MTYSNSEPETVAIGGGNGLSTLLRGLKRHTGRLTAVVTMADDGGGSGVLRDELGMPPPGDVRNCLQALANAEPTMQQLLGYRFTEGTMRGQSLGNLFLAALTDISGSFYIAVLRLSEVLALTGRVLPVTAEDVRLTAYFEDGTQILGESSIREYKMSHGRRIERIKILPEAPPALPEALRAIERADLIILGPGSLYTSIIPNILTSGVPEAIRASDAVKLYILNVATENGETGGFTAADHIREIFRHAGGKIFDYCLAGSQSFPPEVLKNHMSLGGSQTKLDEAEVKALGVTSVLYPLLETQDGFAHHDPEALGAAVMKLYREVSRTKVYKGN
ncbi:MAG: YvcK family protein [Oscillospiraceae bacterium]|jgi:uncharacterized cofD-like protein|nr:YvcK family protein [Oscillospiraceae bacterium]